MKRDGIVGRDGVASVAQTTWRKSDVLVRIHVTLGSGVATRTISLLLLMQRETARPYKNLRVPEDQPEILDEE
jgi:hypothetical protein